MLKQALIYLILSTLVVVFARIAHLAVLYIDVFFTHVTLYLSPIFNLLSLSLLYRKLCVLILIPVILATIPMLMYYLITRKTMPYFVETIWALWLIVVLSDILIR